MRTKRDIARDLFAVAAGLGCLCLGSGCAGVSSPRASVEGWSLAGAVGGPVMGPVESADGAAGETLTLLVRVENPNRATALPLGRVRYRVEAEGVPALEAVRSGEASLPAGGAVTLALPVPAPAGVPASGLYRVSGTVEYIVPGALAEILFDADIRRPRVGFSESGRFTVE